MHMWVYGQVSHILGDTMEVPRMTFRGTVDGKKLLVFGAIHGNEVCGPRAIQRVVDKIRSGELVLASGSVTFVPICNPRAYAANVRLVEENLNRVFRRTDSPASYEAHLANELCAIIEEGFDIFLDLHSMSAPGPVCAFIDYPTTENERLAAALTLEYVLLDWPRVYQNNEHGLESYDTTRYADSLGIPGVLVECGQHTDSESVGVAERIILETFSYAGLIERVSVARPMQPKRVRMQSVAIKRSPGDAFARPWRHLEAIAKGECIATRADGADDVAQEDCYILLPKESATPSEEWYYIGVKA